MSKGVAFIRYDRRDEAERAIERFHGQMPGGFSEKLTVKFANPPNPANNKLVDCGSSSKPQPASMLNAFPNLSGTMSPQTLDLSNFRGVGLLPNGNVQLSAALLQNALLPPASAVQSFLYAGTAGTMSQLTPMATINVPRLQSAVSQSIASATPGPIHSALATNRLRLVFTFTCSTFLFSPPIGHLKKHG